MSDESGSGTSEPSPIPESASEDVPPESNGSPESGTELDDPNAEHRRATENAKLKFAIWFTSGCVVSLVGLTLINYFSPGFAEKSGGGLDSVNDALKLLATTSLGFIFGRTIGNNTD